MNKLSLVLFACLFSSVVGAQGYGYEETGYYGCTAELVNQNGRVIQAFDGYDCYDAQRKCDDELYYRQSQGQNRRAQCRVIPSRPAPPRPTPPRPVPYPPVPRPVPQPQWVEVDQVTFRDSKTAVAIANCRAASQADSRCNGRLRDYQCSPCSDVAHSDQSTYIVFQLLQGQHGPRPVPQPTIQRELERTFHFKDKKTAVARQKCEAYRAALPQCSDSRFYECSPCTIESHTDHSQFDLFRLVRY